MNWLEKIFIVILIAQLVAIGFLATSFIEENKYKELQQSTIDGQKKLIEQKERKLLHAYDSLAQTKILYSDSLREARDLKLKDEKTVKTKTESHEKIVFVNLNDSARHSKLAKFFRSYKHP